MLHGRNGSILVAQKQEIMKSNRSEWLEQDTQFARKFFIETLLIQYSSYYREL